MAANLHGSERDIDRLREWAWGSCLVGRSRGRKFIRDWMEEGLELFFSLLSVCLRSEGGRGCCGHCLSDLVEGGVYVYV